MRFSILRKGIFSILCLARSGHGHFSVGQMRSCAGHIMVRRSLGYVSLQFILWFVKKLPLSFLVSCKKKKTKHGALLISYFLVKKIRKLNEGHCLNALRS